MSNEAKAYNPSDAIASAATSIFDDMQEGRYRGLLGPDTLTAAIDDALNRGFHLGLVYSAYVAPKIMRQMVGPEKLLKELSVQSEVMPPREEG